MSSAVDAPALPSSIGIRDLAARLESDALIVFPVRHHSPACAWQLQRLLAEVRPAVILVEGPRSFTPLIPLLVHAQAKMPLAAYTYAVDKSEGDAVPARRAAYYPFCDYSPELIALRAASRLGVEARFIDLDFAEQCLVEQAGEEGADESRSLLDERHFQRSRYLRSLAERLGCRDNEEVWEHLFEIPAAGRTRSAFLADMAAYCHLARLEYSDAELRADGTLDREAEMAWHIRQALAVRTTESGPVLAVVGGFHAVALPALLQSDVGRPAIKTSQRVAEQGSALIRYSFDRLDRLNGYAAGMTSPAWHQKVWERLQQRTRAGVDAGARVRQEIALTVLFDIADELRGKLGVALPMPTLAAAYEHALQLAELRQRAAPARNDVFDAVTSCFVKGELDADGALVLGVARRLFSGNALGQVPPGASTPPLVRDFAYRARRQRLKIDDAAPRKLVLDLYRRPEHRVTSRLLHGLALLEIPFAQRLAGPDFVQGVGLERLQEHWQYAASAATDAALVEAALYGTTVPLAVAARFVARLERFAAGEATRDAKAATALLVQACLLGLHDHLPRVLATLRDAVAHDSGFESVAGAAGSLGLLWESREPLEARDVAELPALLRSTYERAVFLGRSLPAAAGPGTAILDGLTRLRELLASAAGRDLDGFLYWSLVDALQATHEAPLVRGAAAGLMLCAGRLSEQLLASAVEGHLNGLLQPLEAVAFLRGLLHTAREAAWQQPGLLAVMDRLLRAWSDAEFVAALPELRLAFASMTPKETDRIAEAVAGLHGRQDLGSLVRYDVSAERVQAHLEVSQSLHDLLAADGLLAWRAV